MSIIIDQICNVKHIPKLLESFNITHNSSIMSDETILALLLTSDTILAIKFKVWVITVIKEQYERVGNSLTDCIKNIINSETKEFYNNTVNIKFLNKMGVYFQFGEFINGKIKFKIGSVDKLVSNDGIKLLEFFEVFYFKEFQIFIESSPLFKSVYEEGVYNCEIFTYINLLEFVFKHHEFYKFQINEGSYNGITDKPIVVTKGCKIQQYSLDNRFIETFNSIRDVVKRFNNVTETSIKNAIKSSKEYIGFRWVYLNRELPDDTIQDIGETEPTKHNTADLIAMISLDKTKIVEVFSDQKSAAVARNLKSIGSINNSLKNGTSCSGHYFNYFNKCEDSLKNTYLQSKQLPERPVHSCQIEQIDPKTQQVIKRFNSLIDAQQLCSVSRQSLVKACSTGELLKGYKWKNVKQPVE